MLVYIVEGKTVKLPTIHPLKEGQKENRIKKADKGKYDGRF